MIEKKIFLISFVYFPEKKQLMYKAIQLIDLLKMNDEKAIRNFYNENKIITDNNIINITGEYGEKINIREIKSISLVDSLPDISIKMNGFALETIKKGLFKTQSDETVKLIINSDQHPLLLITTEDGRKIYYSAKTNSNKQLYDELRMRLNK